MTTTIEQTGTRPIRPETAAWLANAPAGQLIDGMESAGHGSELAVADPATGGTLAIVPTADVADVALAVTAARRAFDEGPWTAFSAIEREKTLRRFADLVERDRELLAELETLETGKLLSEARECADELAMVLRYYAGWVDKVEGGVLPAPNGMFAFSTRAPVGVCAAITPWNYAQSILGYKIGPALAMGNTVVVKASELAPLGALHVGRLGVEAGLPEGVLNIITGAGASGAALAGDPRVDKIAFTGSTSTGSKIMAAAAERTARVSLELGGKSAHIVFPDADLEAAADVVVYGAFANAGQLCVAGSRLVVHEDIHDEFVAAVEARVSGFVVGDGLNPASHMGPLITEAARDRVYASVDEASKDGATIVTGGHVIEGSGFFGQPTVVTDLRPNDMLAQRELFGPVLSVLKFKDDADAVRIANATPYGLAAGLWTSDVTRAHTLSRSLVAGSVWVNTYAVFWPTLPFGGMGASGFGRELGPAALEQYSEMKTTVIGMGK